MIFLGFGSSIGDAKNIFDEAKHFLEKNNIEIVRASALFINPPQGGVAKNNFTNFVCEIRTSLSNPRELLQVLHDCEKKFGRERKIKNEDRTLDIDILCFHDKIIKDKLTIPHPRLLERDFVLIPWAEIAPDFIIPTFDISVKELLHKLKKTQNNV